jgi:hypothetical protein
MRKIMIWVAAGIVLLLIGLMPPGPVTGQPSQMPPVCRSLAFSIEEEFVTHGPVPPDGNPIISDGDLLTAPLGGTGACIICARNANLLLIFQVPFDLGLDAVDVVDVNLEGYLVAFSTELNSSNGPGQFTAGDLLATNGAIIPNQVLTYKRGVGYDLGLDGLQFVGNEGAIKAFLTAVAGYPRDYWLNNPGLLAELLEEYSIDIWFSTEEAWSPPTGAPGFLDGDLLSAATGAIIIANAGLLPPSVPAGIPNRGVDFGLDAVAADRSGELLLFHFSTELLFTGEPGFTDGDMLQSGDGVVATNGDLIGCFEPNAGFLGLDALHIGSGGTIKSVYLPVVLKSYR